VSAIETDSFLPYPRATVWRALTDPGLMAEWLMPGDFEPVVGHRFAFSTSPVPGRGFDGRIECEVLELVAPSRLAISWRGGNLDTTVTWTLEAEGSGTRLFLVHDGFDEDDPDQLATMQILGGGWRGHLARRLDSVLATLSA
jgi:uncharacterized protein YndB with AHSA1/START domain